LMVALDRGLVNSLLAIGLHAWIPVCRLARAESLREREREYAQAATAQGAGVLRVVVRHVLPNVLTPVIVAVTVGIPQAIFTQAARSLLGLGVAAPAPAGAADNSVGVRLPADAAPPAKQVLTLIGREGTFIDWSKTVQKSQWHPGLITEALVMQDINSDVKPLAAEKWEVSKDGLTWTFHLRKGLQWSDGMPLTAKDFEYTIKRIANPETGFDVAWYFSMIKNLKEVNEGKGKLDEIGATAVDATTLRLTLTEPTPYLPMILSDLYVVPSHIVSKVGDAWSTSPATAVSAGPFKLEKWDRDRELVFIANRAYRGIRKPY